VKIMKKVLIFLLVLGVLMIGTFAVAEQLPESSDEISDFSEGGNFGNSGLGDPAPCGGGDGGGQGGIPG
jgi:hypothetical protein